MWGTQEGPQLAGFVLLVQECHAAGSLQALHKATDAELS